MAPLSCYWPRAVIHVQADSSDAALNRVRIRQALTGLSADLDLELRGADEAIIDVTHCQQSQGSPERIAQRVQQRVSEANPGVQLRVGVSSLKTLARYAAQRAAPGGLVVIRPWEAKPWLERLPIGDIDGVGPGLQRFLSLHGVTTCAGVASLPLNVLVRRYGLEAEHLWLACQGQDPETAHRQAATFAAVLPPQCHGRRAIVGYLCQLSRKVAAHLRRFDLHAGRLTIRMRLHGSHTAVRQSFALVRGAGSRQYLGALTHDFLARYWHGEVVTHLQIGAAGLTNASGQLELFSGDDTGKGPILPPPVNFSSKKQQQHPAQQQAVDHKRQHAHALQ